MNAIDERACGKPGCDNFGKPGLNIVGHGWFVTKSGRRRRYRCTVCGGTLSTNTGTAYRGLRCSRREFDQVASLRVEGVSMSATARVTGHSRTTIARWLERAATAVPTENLIRTVRGVGARMRAGLRASNRRARHLPMRYETGLPSSVIRFRTLHASTASRRCPDELRARRQSPTIDLYRKNAFSTHAC